MANPEHLDYLHSGAMFWNNLWYELASRHGASLTPPDLQGANLQEMDLSEYDLRSANLKNAKLQSCSLRQATLTEANLDGANLKGAILNRAYLVATTASSACFEGASLRSAEMAGIRLRSANLDGADLVGAKITSAQCYGSSFRSACMKATRLDRSDFTNAILVDADLSKASCVQTCLRGANMDGAKVYGISAWDVDLTGASQRSVIITEGPEHIVTTDDIDVAQFLHLIISGPKIGRAIDGIAHKLVLILGRFSAMGRPVLRQIADVLRRYDLIPLIFDFVGPQSRDATGTIEILARLSRFVIADVTNSSCVPHELAMIVPHLRTIPVLPIRLRGSDSYSMINDLTSYPWVLNPLEYSDSEPLEIVLPEMLVLAEGRRAELLK